MITGAEGTSGNEGSTGGKLNILSNNIKLEDIKSALQFKDLRTVLKWCRNKGVLVVKYGKTQYVNLIDFELALDQPFIEDLQVKYPQNWKELYTAYKNRDYLSILDSRLAPFAAKKTKFEAPGPSGNAFMQKINKKQ